MTTCPHCHHELPSTFREDKPIPYRLTPGLVHVLRKLAVAVERKGQNDVHLEADTDLTYNEQSCTSKLRIFGLIAQVKVEGRKKAKRWLLTRRGWRFLNCLEAVPVEVYALSGHPAGHSPESVLVSSFPITEHPWLQSTFRTFEIISGDVFYKPQGQLALIK